MDAYRKHISQARLSMFTADDDENTNIRIEDGVEPLHEARWIVELIQTFTKPIFILHGAFDRRAFAGITCEAS